MNTKAQRPDSRHTAGKFMRIHKKSAQGGKVFTQYIDLVQEFIACSWGWMSALAVPALFWSTAAANSPPQRRWSMCFSEPPPGLGGAGSGGLVAGGSRSDSLRAYDCWDTPIEAVGLTGQMHGAVMLDAAGEVLRPVIDLVRSTDGGGVRLAACAKIGRERLIELTANPALPNFTLTKLLWVRKHEPEIFGRIAHVLCPKDYVRYRMTGTYAMDVQEASGTLLLDVAHRRWSSEVARIAGIPESWLPDLLSRRRFARRFRRGVPGTPGWRRARRWWRGPGTRGPGLSGWGSWHRGRCRRPSGRRGWCLRLPLRLPAIRRGGCIPSAMRCRGGGMSWG